MKSINAVAAWNELIGQFSGVVTVATARVWTQIITGWLMHHGPATVTGMIRVLGDQDWSAITRVELAGEHETKTDRR